MNKLRQWFERLAEHLFGLDPDPARDLPLSELHNVPTTRSVASLVTAAKPETMPPGDDIMSGRCREGRWRKDDTCNYCGGHRPSKALEAMTKGAQVVPTDKSYKCYVDGLGYCGKVYFNHFGEAQAVELVRRIECKELNLADPGYFYAGLPFTPYKSAIEKLLRDLKEPLPLP